MSFGERMQEALRVRGMSQADLCRKTGLKSGHITPYIKSEKSETLPDNPASEKVG